MRVLVVDDEEGIREGLASFLRHHGHEVHTAAACAEASAVLATAELDVLVTDWRLTDGTARPLLATTLPVIVITGCPEEIDAGRAVVLRKPVLPDALLTHLAAAARPAPATAAANAAAIGAMADLPPDTRDRIRLLLQGLAGTPTTVEDDGTFVTVTIDLSAGAEPDPGLLARLGGDWTRHGSAGVRHGRWRCYRDGRPASVAAVIGAGDPWPGRPGAVAIDLHGRDLAPDALLPLLDRVTQARQQGREVHVLNVPSHLRLWLELLGRAHDLPMRTCSGPRLPATARELWS